jgi:cysteine desulfurase
VIHRAAELRMRMQHDRDRRVLLLGGMITAFEAAGGAGENDFRHPALALTGNASSVHAEGRAARQAIELARDQVAALVGAEAKNVTFTSGATEANMLALTPALELGGRKEPRDRLFVSAVEHPSVLCGGRFPANAVEILPVNGDGIVDLVELERCLLRAECPLVSVMQANNETGVIQPISEIAAIVHAANGVLHVDAVQAAGRIDCSIAQLTI